MFLPCYDCGAAVPGGLPFCPRCGAYRTLFPPEYQLKPVQVFLLPACPDCNTQVSQVSANYCRRCGNRFPWRPEPLAESRSSTNAAYNTCEATDAEIKENVRQLRWNIDALNKRMNTIEDKLSESHKHESMYT